MSMNLHNELGFAAHSRKKLRERLKRNALAHASLNKSSSVDRTREGNAGDETNFSLTKLMSKSN